MRTTFLMSASCTMSPARGAIGVSTSCQHLRQHFRAQFYRGTILGWSVRNPSSARNAAKKRIGGATVCSIVAMGCTPAAAACSAGVTMFSKRRSLPARARRCCWIGGVRSPQSPRHALFANRRLSPGIPAAAATGRQCRRTGHTVAIGRRAVHGRPGTPVSICGWTGTRHQTPPRRQSM